MLVLVGWCWDSPDVCVVAISPNGAAAKDARGNQHFEPTVGNDPNHHHFVLMLRSDRNGNTGIPMETAPWPYNSSKGCLHYLHVASDHHITQPCQQ